MLADFSTRPFWLLTAAIGLGTIGLAGCQSVVSGEGAAPASDPVPARPSAPLVEQLTVPPKLSAGEALQNFEAVADVMEPRISKECAFRTHGRESCDYQILVDRKDRSGPNAFQSVDAQGRPVIAFNPALIAEARNPDELAFVIGHEAAHYILGHIRMKDEDAMAGALILGVLAAASGEDGDGIAEAQVIGAAVGERAYSQDYELQADRLGTVIAWDAGFNPVKGAQFFARLPDPGEDFLNSHPPNRMRLDLVKRTVSRLEAGQPG